MTFSHSIFYYGLCLWMIRMHISGKNWQPMKFCVFSRGKTTENGSAKHLKREGVCQLFDLWKKYFLNLHKIFLLTMVLLSWCKAFSHSAVRLKLQWWVAPCANFCSAMFMLCVIVDWCNSRLLFRHKDAGSVTKLYRKPELSSIGRRLRCLHGPRSNVVSPHGIVVDRSNRPYCGTDIKLQEVAGCPRFCCRKQTEQSVHDRLIFGATNL